MYDHAAVCLVLLCVTAGALAAPEALIDTEFGAADQPIVDRSGRANERVTGVMAGEWRDNSDWAPDVYAHWERLEEEGRSFLRLHVTKLEAGRCQLAHALPRVTEETFYRLSMTARSMSGTSVQIGVRDSGRPYTFHWEQRQRLAASWRDYEYEFRLTELQQDVGFWINVGVAGQLDLARLRLTRLARADYIEELERKFGEAGIRNLIRISRFPLGLQSGWALGRDNSDGDDVQIEPDPEHVGPSGAPGLRIRTNEPTVLRSAPFGVPLGFRPHTASLYVRGSGEMKLVVQRDGRQIAQQSFGLGEAPAEWRRIHVTFQPTLMARAYSLRIEAGETFWIDALQVEPGEQPGPYASQQPCEVALACPPSDASVARVQFEDEAAEVLYYVTGECAGGVLRCKVVNVYGEEEALPAIRLGEDTRGGRIEYDAFPETDFGPFRVEAWVEDAEGNRISTYNELVVNRLPRPRYWGKDAPDSPFGVHTNSTTRHNLMVKAVGANWTRLHDAGLQYLGWYHLEPEPGKWTFRDKEIHRYRRDHIKVLGELGTAPEWASYHPGKRHSSYFDRYYQPKRLEDYANYVRTVAQRYRGVIDAYDVWNEPWIHAWWGAGYDESKSDRDGYVTSEDAPGDFVRLMQTAFETAKSVDPDITVLGVNSTTGGGSSRSFGGSEWTEAIVAAGGIDYCDAVCYHQYIGGRPGYPGDVVERGFQTATGAIEKRFGGLPKPVWMTEGSAGRDVIGPGFYNHTLPFENAEDPWDTADRLCRYVVSLLAQGVSKVFLYSMHAQSSLDAPSSWRVIVSSEGYLHPSGAAHAILAWHLEDTRFVKTLTITDGVFAYLFEGATDTRSVAVLSSAPGHAEYVLPDVPGAKLADLFGSRLRPGQPLGDTLAYLSAAAPVAELEKSLRSADPD